MIEDLYALLDPDQAAAAASDAPLISCIAGAGSGKTRMLAGRVVRLLMEGHAPDEILCVTFTRKAAEEMSHRIHDMAALAGYRIRSLPEIRTLHSWAASFLRYNASAIGRTSAFSIYDETDREALVRTVARDLNIKNPDQGKLGRLSRDPQVATEVAARLQRCNALTFDMIEGLAVGLLDRDPRAAAWALGRYRHVLVDEYQDTNPAQDRLATHASRSNLFLVGDLRQAIYGFRGADITVFERAMARSTVFELTRNYRSHADIVAIANHVAGGDVAPMQAMMAADVWAPEPVIWQGGPTVHHAVAEAIDHAISDGYAPEHIAVLARAWRELQAVDEHLVIPHTIRHSAGDPWALPDWRTWAWALHLLNNPMDDHLASLLGHHVAGPGVHLGRCHVQALRERKPLAQVLAALEERWAVFSVRNEDRLTMGDAIQTLLAFGLAHDGAREAELLAYDDVDAFLGWWGSRHTDVASQRPDEEGVVLTTVHGAKGLEWPVVIVADPRENAYYDNDEDRRLLYVAVTRAKKRLVLCTEPKEAPGPWGRGVIRDPERSPLLVGAP